jgi:hypothetical protein
LRISLDKLCEQVVNDGKCWKGATNLGPIGVQVWGGVEATFDVNVVDIEAALAR